MVQKHGANQTYSQHNVNTGSDTPEPQQTFTGGAQMGGRFKARKPNKAFGNQTWAGGSDTKLKELATELQKMVIAENDAIFKDAVVCVLDKTKTGYEESFIVVAVNENRRVYVTPLFSSQVLRKSVKETVDANSPRLEMYPLRGIQTGSQIEYLVPTVPSDISRDVAFKTVLQQELNAAGLSIESEDHILRAGAITIPTTLDLDSEESRSELLWNVSNQIQTALAAHDHSFLNFKEVDELRGSPINVYIQPNEFGTQEDMLSLPIHSPLRIELSQHVQQNGLSLRDTSGELGYVGAYVDALYLNKQTQVTLANNAAAAAANNPVNIHLAEEARDAKTRKYRQVLVLTKLARYSGGSSPQDLLFNLAALPTLQENNFIHNAWCLPDNPRHRNPLLDIGAFGYETALTDKVDDKGVGVKERINTQDASFGQNEQRGLINRLFYPNIIPAIDVLQSGPSQLFNSLFSGDQISGEILMQAAADLTEERIYNYFSDPKAIVIPGGSGVTPWGVYTNADGQTRDIREIFNYLGWLNFVTQGKKPDLATAQREMERWSFAVEESADRTPEFTRYMEKLEMMKEMTQGTFRQLDKMERRYINVDFIKGLRLALEECGLQFVNTSNQQNHVIQAVRGASFISGITGSMASGVQSNANPSWGGTGPQGQFGAGTRHNWL